MNEFTYDMLYLVSEVANIIFKFGLLFLIYKYIDILEWSK